MEIKIWEKCKKMEIFTLEKCILFGIYARVMTDGSITNIHLSEHQPKFRPMYFHPTSQRLTREKIPPLTFSHTGSTCDEGLHVFEVDYESPVIPLVQ